MQGDVESIASKNPKELTALLEQISGSDEFKREYEELEEKKARAEEKSALIYQKKRTIVMERKQKKEQKEEAEKHMRLQDELVGIIKFCSKYFGLISYKPIHGYITESTSIVLIFRFTSQCVFLYK